MIHGKMIVDCHRFYCLVVMGRNLKNTFQSTAIIILVLWQCLQEHVTFSRVPLQKHHPDVSFKKKVLEYFAKFTEKHLSLNL